MEYCTELLQGFIPISLEEMEQVRLMNRVDTKYVTTVPTLCLLLQMAANEYRIQEIGGLRNMPYCTLYYDTFDYAMFSEHHRGRKHRQKIRFRTYEDSGTAFIEIKTKNNKGRTRKKRILAKSGYEIEPYAGFILSHSFYKPETLVKQVEKQFSRITLVNRNMTERLTIDTNLRFHNIITGYGASLNGLVIIELKRDGKTYSPIMDAFRKLRIMPSGFSKYCIGMALTNKSIRQNRMKQKLRTIERLCQNINK